MKVTAMQRSWMVECEWKSLPKKGNKLFRWICYWIKKGSFFAFSLFFLIFSIRLWQRPMLLPFTQLLNVFMHALKIGHRHRRRLRRRSRHESTQMIACKTSCIQVSRRSVFSVAKESNIQICMHEYCICTYTYHVRHFINGRIWKWAIRCIWRRWKQKKYY